MHACYEMSLALLAHGFRALLSLQHPGLFSRLHLSVARSHQQPAYFSTLGWLGRDS
jgi:hypothetical protein